MEINLVTEIVSAGYAVSKCGKVYSASGWRGIPYRELAQVPNAHGYASVRLNINGRRRHLTTHRIVAAFYLPARPSPEHEIRHMDGNRMNPSASNLAWGTRKENAEDRERHGRTSRGDRHSMSIRNSDQAEATRRYWARKSKEAA